MDNPRKSYLNLLKSESDSISRSEEDIKHFLVEEGFDYDKLKIRGQELANKLILKAKASVMRAELQLRFQTAKATLSMISQLGEQGLDKIQSLFEQKFGKRYSLNFRDLKNMNPEEATNILSDIEILEFLEKEKLQEANEKP